MRRPYQIKVGVHEAIVERYGFEISFTIRDESPKEVVAKADKIYREYLHERCQNLIRAKLKYSRQYRRWIRERAEKFAEMMFSEHQEEWKHIQRTSYGAAFLSCVPWKWAKKGEFLIVSMMFAVACRRKVLTLVPESGMR